MHGRHTYPTDNLHNIKVYVITFVDCYGSLIMGNKKINLSVKSVKIKRTQYSIKIRDKSLLALLKKQVGLDKKIITILYLIQEINVPNIEKIGWLKQK